MSKLASPQTLDEVVEGLTQLTKHDTKSTDILREEVRLFLDSYSGDDWKKYTMFDETTYTRNRIFLDPEERFELIVLCWNISQMTPIHNHPDSQCFFKLLQGELQERTYEMPKKNKSRRMKETGSVLHNKIGKTGYIDDGMGVHLVENLSPSEPCVTLHLYAPAYKSVNCYDERTGKIETHGISNYSVKGVRCVNED